MFYLFFMNNAYVIILIFRSELFLCMVSGMEEGRVKNFKLKKMLPEKRKWTDN